MSVVGRYHHVRGVRAFVETAGEGVPVLLLHTAGQSALQWRHVLDRAPAGYHWIAPDLPGHGRSAGLPAPVEDLHWYGEWCLELMDQLGGERPFVAGCSIGGKIGLDLAVHHGDRLRGVVACAADARNILLSVAGLRRSLDEAGSPSRTDRTELGTYASVGRDVPRALAEEIGALHRREDPVVTTHDLIGWASHDVRHSLKAITCPVRMVAGEDDYWVRVDDVEATAASIPGAVFTLLPRIGHYPMEELPDFGDRLVAWFTEMGPLPGAVQEG